MARKSIKLVAVSENTVEKIEALASSIGIKANEAAEIILRSTLALLKDSTSVRSLLSAGNVMATANRLGLTPIPLNILEKILSSLDDNEAAKLVLETSRSIAILVAALKHIQSRYTVAELLRSLVTQLDVYEEKSGGSSLVIVSGYLRNPRLRKLIRMVAETLVMSMGFTVASVEESEGVLKITYTR